MDLPFKVCPQCGVEHVHTAQVCAIAGLLSRSRMLGNPRRARSRRPRSSKGLRPAAPGRWSGSHWSSSAPASPAASSPRARRAIVPRLAPPSAAPRAPGLASPSTSFRQRRCPRSAFSARRCSQRKPMQLSLPRPALSSTPAPLVRRRLRRAPRPAPTAASSSSRSTISAPVAGPSCWHVTLSVPPAAQGPDATAPPGEHRSGPGCCSSARMSAGRDARSRGELV
jgi:hypothetical protein